MKPLAILLLLLMGCSSVNHIHVEPKIIIEDICASGSRFIDCYNRCRDKSSCLRESDLCTKKCYMKICKEEQWDLWSACDKGGLDE